MRRRRLIPAIALGLGLALLVLSSAGAAGSAEAQADLCVDDYATIQEAINAAIPGDLVAVPVGHYTEMITVVASITLQGGWDTGCGSRITSDPSQTVVDAAGAGSVLRLTSGSPTIEALTLTGGRATRGGGVLVDGASATLSGVLVTGNAVSTTASEWTYGAGVCLWTGDLRLDHTDVVSNIAYAHDAQHARGAGIAVHSGGATAILRSTRILSNTNAPGVELRGGGLHIGSGSQVQFDGQDNLIAYNRASFGGGIATVGDVTVLGATVLSNTAEQDGGGVQFDPGSGGAIANCIIAGNGAMYGGDGLLANRAQIEVANNTFVSNVGGAGVGVERSRFGSEAVTLTNNIIVGHATAILNRNSGSPPVLVTNDLWDNGRNYQDVVTGTTDLFLDPAFVNAGGGDYHLSGQSPLINAGTTLPWLTVDFEGDPRPTGAAFDIGADEFARYGYIPVVVRAYSP
jgi:hypothetical protein